MLAVTKSGDSQKATGQGEKDSWKGLRLDRFPSDLLPVSFALLLPGSPAHPFPAASALPLTKCILVASREYA